MVPVYQFYAVFELITGIRTANQGNSGISKSEAMDPYPSRRIEFGIQRPSLVLLRLWPVHQVDQIDTFVKFIEFSKANV